MPTTRKKVIKTVYKDEEDSDEKGDFSDSGSDAVITEQSSSDDEVESPRNSDDDFQSKKPIFKNKVPASNVKRKKTKFTKTFLSKISKQESDEQVEVPLISVKDLTEADKLLPSFLNLSESDSSDDEQPSTSTKKNIVTNFNTNLKSESEDEDEAKTEYKDVFSNNVVDESAEIARKTFLELEQHKNKIEEAKITVQKYTAKMEENESDVKDLLALGEEEIIEASPSKVKKRKVKNNSDSEMEDWEEVDENKAVIPQQGLQLVVDIPGMVKKKTKKLDVEMMLKRKMNRVKKQYQIFMHKVHVLCWLGHGNHVSQVLNDQEVLAAALSFVPSNECYPGERVDMKYIEQITLWYKDKMSINQDKHENKFRPKAPHLKDILLQQMKKRVFSTKKYMVYVFVSMLRSLGLQCRVMFNFVTLPIRPPVTELCSLSTKVKEETEDTKNSDKPKSQSKAKSKTKKNIPQLDGIYDASESDDENIMQVDGGDDNTTVRTRRQKNLSLKKEKLDDDKKEERVSPSKRSKMNLSLKTDAKPGSKTKNTTEKSEETTSKKIDTEEEDCASPPKRPKRNLSIQTKRTGSSKAKSVNNESNSSKDIENIKKVTENTENVEKSSTRSRRNLKNSKTTSSVTKEVEIVTNKKDEVTTVRSKRKGLSLNRSVNEKEQELNKDKSKSEAQISPKSKNTSSLTKEVEIVTNKKEEVTTVRSKRKGLSLNRSVNEKEQELNKDKSKSEAQISPKSKNTSNLTKEVEIVTNKKEEVTTVKSKRKGLSLNRSVNEKEQEFNKDKLKTEAQISPKSKNTSSLTKEVEIVTNKKEEVTTVKSKRKGLSLNQSVNGNEQELNKDESKSEAQIPPKSKTTSSVTKEEVEIVTIKKDEVTAVKSKRKGLSLNRSVNKKEQELNKDKSKSEAQISTKSNTSKCSASKSVKANLSTLTELTTSDAKNSTKQFTSHTLPKIVLTDVNNETVSSEFFEKSPVKRTSRKRSQTTEPKKLSNNTLTSRTRSAHGTESKYFSSDSNEIPAKKSRITRRADLDDDKRVSHRDLAKKKPKPKNDVTNDLVHIIKERVKEAKTDAKKLIVKGKQKEESDADSDYLAVESPKSRTSDEDFVEKKITPKQKKAVKKIDRRVVSTDDEQPLNKINVWCEIYVEELEEWVPVDVVRGKVHCANELYSSATHPVTYIVGWDNSNYLKDLTKRYVPYWNTVTRKQRVDAKWWQEAIQPWLGPNNARDREEDERLDRMQLEAPLPKVISEYKNHPLYVLKRHLLKFEAIYPPDAATLGFVRGEPVYARDCVYICKSRDVWIKDAKVVKPGEQPYKIVRARPKYIRATNTFITDRPLEIFGPWQTQDYEPPTAENGIVPRNPYGNVELFKKCMLPKGTVHINLPGLQRVAKKLNIDCAPALTGFDCNGGYVHPVYEGFVICEEFEKVITEAWIQDQEELERKEQEKTEARVYGNWKRLIRGLVIKEQLKAKYGFAEPSTSRDKKKVKGPRLVVKKK